MSSSASSPPSKATPPTRGDVPDSAQPNSGGTIPSADNQQTVISHRAPVASGNRHVGDAPTRQGSAIKRGTKLGDIELIEHIGGGGMGQVFRGEDKRLGRPVAVKVLSLDQSTDQDSVRRFLNEAKSAARLNHQNIAQVYSAGESEDHPYIVFEFVEGINLRTMIEEQGPLMLEEALSFTLQIADALAHAADRRIVHRDVKPSNVLIAPNGHAKLIDLGLARLSSGANPEGDLTASGVTLGTFDYISPEQARDPRNADSRSDIYSLGCTLFYMLAGRPPFPAGTVLQKLLQHQGDEPPDICQFRPDLPEDVSLVLARMMAKDPRRRYPDSARLMEALFSLAEQIGLRPVGPARAIWLPPHESRISTLHRQTPWLAPTLILACLILVLHLAWSDRGELIDVRGFRSNLGERSVSVEATTGADPSLQLASGQLPGSRSGYLPTVGEQENGSQTNNIGPEPGSTDLQPPGGALYASSPTSDAPLSGSLSAQLWVDTGNSLAPRPLGASLVPTGQSAGISIPSLFGSPRSGNLPAPSGSPSEVQLVSAPANGTTSAVPLAITPTQGDSSQFSSIGAALAVKPDTDLIELNYDGPRVERPLTFANRQLTIRAAAGRAPIVVFQPTGTDPILCPRDMIQVTGGKLMMEGVAMEMEIPRDMPSESWALVRLTAGGRVDFKSCSLRVRNASDSFSAYHRDVAFFRATLREGARVGRSDPIRLERTPDIELEDCLACGEACFVQISESLPFLVTWRNGILITTEAAFLVGGSSRTPSPDMTIGIDLSQVTAVTGGALLHLALAAHRPHIAPIRFSVSSCVAESHPLILGTGVVSTPGDLRSRLTWVNKSSSAIQGGSPPMVLRDASDSIIQDDDLTMWLQGAGLDKTLARLVWQAAAPAGPKHSMSPGDFILNMAESGIPADTVPAPGFLTSPVPGVPPAQPVSND